MTHIVYNWIHESINKLSLEIAGKKESYIKLHIQPKPKWLPNFIWKKVLSRLLIMAEFTR